MLKEFKKILIDSFMTILPVILIVLVLCIFMPIGNEVLVSFLISSVLLIIGSALFTFGADLSIVVIGNKIGKDLIKSGKLWLILIVSLIIGTVVTIAEPDLFVLAEQLTLIPSYILIIAISLGVGFCLLIASLRSLYGWNLNIMLTIGFFIIFALMFFVNPDFVPAAFDSGGVTTGTMSIPFIITLGMGLVASRIDNKAKEDSFGLVGLASTGPIIMVLLLGMFYNSGNTSIFDSSIYTEHSFSNYIIQFIGCFKDVFLSVSPIIVVFIIYELLTRKTNKIEIHRIILGILLTIIGLTIFLVASNVGFLNMGYYIGEFFTSNYKYMVIPIIMILAYFIAIAEPAVVILVEQVVSYTEGAISSKVLKFALAIGVSIAAGLSILRVFMGTPFGYYAIVGYGIALVLMLFIPKVFTAIAFDAGGATGGSLTTTFLLPIAIGACVTIGGNVYTDAFGLASMVSLIPIITVEMIGLVYQFKLNAIKRIEELDDSIIDYDWEGNNG